MIILIVLLSVIPMVVEYQRERRRTSPASAESGSNQ
jgi:hypothetical protein